MIYFIALQTSIIEEKIANAPDENYQIGLAIGSYLPFVLLVIVAYVMYHKAKKKQS